MAEEFIVEGAICLCKHGASPGKIKVADNSFFMMNGNKFTASTMTLGNAMYPPGFGVCRINPLYPKPCMPAITGWCGYFKGIKTSAGGNPLTDESKGTCGSGSPDCIEFSQTGQIPVPGPKQFAQATAEHQGELDPMGEPTGLQEHQTDLKAGFSTDTPSHILIVTVEGPEKSLAGDHIEYHVSKYNVDNPSADIRGKVKWKVLVDNNEQPISQPGNDVLKLTVKQEWQNKELVVMPYLNQSTDRVSKKTKIIKWTFPIVIDRYKMPGLNETGTDIADDMCFGFGQKPKKQICTIQMVEDYKKVYSIRKYNNTVDGIFSNAEDYDPNPPLFTTQKPTYKDSFDKSVRILHGKTKYGKEEIYGTSYKTNTWFGSISTGWLVKVFNKYMSIKSLWWNFEETVKLYFAMGDLKTNIANMIAKFKRNEGGIYESDILTKAITSNHKTLKYCEKVEKYLREKIQKCDLELSKVEDKDVYFVTKEDIEARSNRNKDFTRPIYNDSKTEGLTIALNDIWSTEIILTDVKLDNDRMHYTAKYKVTLWDHFGLNKPDMEKIFNVIPSVQEAFACWFTLQHLKGYKPFITKIVFEKEFKGILR